MTSAEEKSDEELLASARTGDQEAFRVLFNRYKDGVLSLALHKGVSRDEAPDVVQETFVKLHRLLERYDPRFKVAQFIFVIARSVALDARRASKRRHTATDLSQNPDTEAYYDEREEEVAGTLEHLPPKDQEIVKRRIILEQDFSEIARSLGKSEVAVRQALSRALRRLRTALKAKG